MGFGTNLRKLREAKGITLRQFAKDCELSATYLSRIEKEQFPPPSANTIQRIADQLGVDGDLMTLYAGKIPDWIKDLLSKKGDACVAALREINGL